MKTKILALLIAVAVSGSLLAQDSSSIEERKFKTEDGSAIERITYKYGSYDIKVETAYNALGNLQERTSYKWDLHTHAWIPVNKYEYVYGIAATHPLVMYSKWNREAKSWSKKTKVDYAVL